jgi:hypothetical protein
MRLRNGKLTQSRNEKSIVNRQTSDQKLADFVAARLVPMASHFSDAVLISTQDFTKNHQLSKPGAPPHAAQSESSAELVVVVP